MYPALAVVQTLANNTEVLWVGSEGGMESTLVQRASIPYETIPAAGLHGVGIVKMPKNLYLLMKGLLASKRILKQFNPDVVFFTGGFLAVPMAFAARNTPIVLFTPDIEPGLAIKTIARFSDVIVTTSIKTREYFNSNAKVIETGYPVRHSLETWTKKNGREHFTIKGKKPVVLFFGGSKGARSINQAVSRNVEALLEFTEIIHISGELDWEEIERTSKSLSLEKSLGYHCFPYLHEDMGAALASADLVVSRAGASILGEYPMFSLPAILVPYPHAWRYQSVNAEYLVEKGAAVMLEDSRLGNELVPTIKQLINDPEQLSKMRKSMQSLFKPGAARMIADQLVSLAGNRSTNRD